MDQNNVVICLKDNEAGRKASTQIEEVASQYMDLDGMTISCVFSKKEFDDCLYTGLYSVGFILEKIEETPMSFGAIKNWKKLNPEARIILVMSDDRLGGSKPSGLYEKGYYDGLFMKDFCTSAMFTLMIRGRTKEEAYSYYKVDEYEEKQKNEETKEEPKEVITSESTSEAKKGSEAKEENKSNVQNQKNTSSDDVALKEAKKTETLTDNLIINTEIAAGVDIADALKESEESEYVEGMFTTEFLNLEGDDSVSKQEILTQSEGTDGVSATESDEEVYFLKKEEQENNRIQNYIIENKKSKNEKVLKHLDDEAFLSRYIDEKSLEAEENVSPVAASGTAIEMFTQCMDNYANLKEAWLKKALMTSQRDEFINDAYDFIENYETSKENKQECFELLINYAWGYDVLTPLIDLDDVIEIHVIDYDKIRVKTKKGRNSTPLTFLSRDHYLRFVRNIELRNIKKRISEGMTKTYTDRDFSKENILQVSVIDGATSNNGVPELMIKKYSQKKLRIRGMIGEKLSVRSAAAIINAVRSGRGIVLCGPSGCGASTLLNAMIEYIPRDKNGIVLEHKDELTNSNHPEIMIRFPVGEIKDDNGTVTRPARSLETIASDALYRDVDYYILSDVRGNEALSLFSACNAGFTIWTNVRAASCEEAMSSIVNYIVSAEPTLVRDNVCELLASKISTVVFMKDLRVVEIKELTDSRYNVTERSFVFKDININGSSTFVEEAPAEKTNV